MTTGVRTTVAVAGGSGAGLLVGLVLARAGHRVEIVERDELGAPERTVETAADHAFRRGAPQLVQPHVLLPLFRLLLREHLPDVLDALLAAGTAEADEVAQRPATLSTTASPDERLTLIMTRRSTVDLVLRRAVAAEPAITLRMPVGVWGLRTDGRRVTGLDTDAGPVAADVVVDATGRRSPIDRWLAAIGAPPTVREAAECGVAYYARHYRLRRRTDLPGPTNNRVVMPLDEFTAGFWGADNDTMVLGVCPLAEDRRFRDLSDPARFTEVLRTVPVLAAWLDAVEPIGDVHAMGGLDNTLRRLVVGPPHGDRAPVVGGLHAVGDSVCATNPTLARGLGMALRGALDLRDALAAWPGTTPADDAARARAVDAAVDAHIAPFYRDQAVVDAARLAQVRARIAGRTPPAPPTDPDRVTYAELAAAAQTDASLFSTLTELKGMLRDPDAVYVDPDVVARVRGGPPSRPSRTPTTLHAP